MEVYVLIDNDGFVWGATLDIRMAIQEVKSLRALYSRDFRIVATSMIEERRTS